MKRAVLYLRVSTIDQTTANQESELRQIAGHMGCQIVKAYKDHGISGAKGRNGRPAFDALCKAAARLREARRGGLSVRKAAAKFGVSPGTVLRIPSPHVAGASAAAG